MSKPKPLALTTSDEIPYTVLDPTPGGGNLGRAEFQFCPTWRDGEMKYLTIYRKQQRREPSVFKLKLPKGITTFSFESYGGDGLDRRPRPWRMWWCSEHAAVGYEVYVPDATDHIRFDLHFGNSVDIIFAKRSRA